MSGGNASHYLINMSDARIHLLEHDFLCQSQITFVFS